MTPFEVYCDYLSLKNHFNKKNYDYHKYNGKSTASKKSFDKRKDKIFFEKLSKHRDPHSVILANFITSDKVWIRDIAYGDASEKIYEDWLKRSQSITYVINGDLSKLDENFDDNFKILDGQPPKIFKLYMAKKITLETICVLADVIKCMTYWDKKLSNDPVWDLLSLKFKKYTPFIRYDKDKIKRLVVDKFAKS